MKPTQADGTKPNAPEKSDRWVRFTCSEGHRLKADRCFAGQTAVCPTCGGKAKIPSPVATSLTDTGALRLLEEAPATSGPSDARPQSIRNCPRCGASLPASVSICHACRLYLFPSEAWRSLVRGGSQP